MDFSSLLPAAPWFALLIVIVLGLFWIFQFSNLMSLDDAAFYGRHDRYGWIAVFVMLWPIAPFAYVVWAGNNRRRFDRSRE